MPTLADIYSAIDSAKRKGSDLIRNPGASLQQIAGYGIDRANAARDQLYQATEEEGIGYGPKTKALASQMAQSYNPIGMTTWHGSPHVFEKFDLSKLGTGEGAQAYGSGMYVAQNPTVATDYRNVLTGNQNRDKFIPTVDGKEIDSPVIRSIINKGGNPEKFIQDMQPKISNLQKTLSNASKNEVLPGVSDYDMAKMDLDRHLKMIDEAKNYIGKTIKNEPLGSLYKVDLPDTHIRRMLDWDAPIKEQPMIVRKLAKSLGMDMNDLGGDLLAQVGKDEAGRKIMQDAGIRGVKYLDEKSRYSPHEVSLFVRGKPYASNQFVTKEQAEKYAAEKKAEGFDATYKNVGTRNFVVFDPNHMKILERNSEKIK